MPLKKAQILKYAKGFRGRAKNCFRIARIRVEKAMQKPFVSRKLRKRDFRREWIVRVSAATREYGLKYSQFIYGLSQHNIRLDRKVLSQLAMYEPFSFKALVDQVKFMRGGK